MICLMRMYACLQYDGDIFYNVQLFNLLISAKCVNNIQWAILSWYFINII